MRFYDPLNDVAFKKVFGSENHKNITISFLNAILELTGENEIIEVNFELMNVERQRLGKDAGKNFFDVYCKVRSGERFIVEMQKRKMDEFGKRMVYYGAKAYAEQLKTGTTYRDLCPVIVISVVNFVMFPKKKSFKSLHDLRDRKTNECDLKELAFAFVELPKFNTQEHALRTNEDRWLFFLKEISTRDETPFLLDQKEFADACHILESEQWSDSERDAYEKAFILETDEEGKLAVALAEGLAKGIEQGKTEGQKQIVHSLLTKLTKTEVAKLIGLSLEEIEKLQ